MRKLLIVGGLLVLLVAACVPAAGTVNPAQLEGGEWSLLNIQYPDGEVAAPDFGEYTVDFSGSENRMYVMADCNQGSASYEADTDGSLVLGPLTQTMMACPPGSMGSEYALQLGMASQFGFEGGYLYLTTQDGVSLVFER